jgi:ATP-binding cassette, subfamily B, bacterial
MASFSDILRYYQRYWPIAIATIVSSSLLELLDLVVPYAIGQLLNVLSQQPLDAPIQGLTQLLSNRLGLSNLQQVSIGLLLGFIFLTTVVRAPIQPWISSWFHWDIALRSRRDQAQNVIAKILSLPLEFYDENNPGRIAGRIARGIENHTWSYPEIAGQMIPKLVRVLGIFIMITWVDWRVAVGFLASFVLILWFSLRKLQRLIEWEEALDRYSENTESRTSEIITNIKTVKAFASEPQELKRQGERIERQFKVVDYRIHRGYVHLNVKQKTVIQTCVFLILGYMLANTIAGRVSLGQFVTTLTVSSMAYAELEPISMLAEIFARRYASMLRFHDFMRQPNGQDVTNLERATVPAYQFTGKIEFSNVTFGYDSDRPVLEAINLLIEPYKTVALVGRSGSGKSTLVKLLYRYFQPQQGKIMIDGEDIQTLDIAGYRKRLAVVHQDVDVFNGTLLDNLVYGNPQASWEEVQAACQVARADEFIQQLSEGYYTIVGERGVRLSGGQRQRLGIARALLVNPDVLIFDEATSSLDYESERSIQLAMRSILGTRTTLIIAHRLSTIREADQIVVLDQGRILEIGNHEELLQQQGIYHRLHTLQATGELV